MADTPLEVEFDRKDDAPEPILVYAKDPLLCFIHDHPGICAPWKMFLWYIAVFIGVKVVLAFFSDVLWTPGMARIVVSDLHRFGPFMLLSTKLFKHKAELSLSNPPIIPYLRDYTEMVVMTLMAVHMVLISKQWHNISIAFRKLYDDDVLDKRIITLCEFHRICKKYNRLFNYRTWTVLSFVISILLVSGVYFSAWLQGSIYPGLDWLHEAGWQQHAYEGWWANFASHPVLALYTIFVAAVIVSYMIRHVIIGFIGVWLVREVFSSSKGSVLTLRLDHEDGLCGLGILKSNMAQVVLSSSIGVLSLVFVWQAFGIGSSNALVWLCAMFLLGDPVFVAVPLAFFRFHITRAKRAQIAVRRKKLRELPDGLNSHIHDHIRAIRLEQEVSKITAIPSALFSPQRIALATFTYYVPALLFVDWILRN